MTKLTVIAAVVTLAVGVSSTLLGQTAHAATASARCSSHRAYRSDSTVIVYRRAAGFDDGVGNQVTLYYACARPNGASVAIASAAGAGEYPSNDVLRDLLLAGNFAGSITVQGTGDQSVCQKYAGSGCPMPVTVLRAADAHSRRLVSIPVPSGTHGLVLSPSHNRIGAAVWLEPSGSGSTLVGTELVPRGSRLSSAPYKLDTGAISSVHVTGETVTWRRAGASHHVALHAAG